MADENRKASRIPGISKYKAPGESLVKINQGDVANSQLFLPDVDDPSTYDEWGKLFNTLTFPQLTGSLKELKAFLDEWKLLGDATIAKSNSSEYSILNNNLKTVGVKVGFSNLITADTSRLFVHGFDKEGRPADKDGFFFLNDDLTELANAENPAVESGTTGSIVAERVTISKTSLGPISTTFVNQITFLIIEKSGAVFVPKLISLPKDQINELATDYKFNAWNKATDSLSSASTIATNLTFPSAPTNYAKWYDSISGTIYTPYSSETDSIVTRETTNWNSTSRTVTAPANVSNYSIKTRLLKEIFVLGICDTKLVSSKVVFNNFSMFPTPVSFLSFQLLFEADRNFLDFRVKDFKDKEALFKKIHDEINNRVLDSNKIKGEIDRNLRPYTLKKQNEAGEDLIVLEYFNNTANSVVQSLFKNDVLDNAVAYPVGLATRKRLFSASLLNDDLNEVWLHGRNSAKVLKLGLAGSTTNTTTELLTGFKINGDFLATGAVSMSSTLNVTGAVSLAETLSVTGNTTLVGDLAINGGDLTSSATTFNLLVGTVTTANLFTAAATLNLAGTTAASTHNYSSGATVSGATKNINLGTGGVSGSTTNVNIGSSAGAGTFNSFLNTILNKTLNVTGATTLTSTLGVTGIATFSGDVLANSGILNTTATTFNLLLGATNTVNFASDTANINIGSSETSTQNINLATGATVSGSAKTIKIGANSASGSTTNIEVGSAVAGALGTVNIYQALVANKEFSVSGTTSLNSTLNVTGVVTLASNLSVNGGTIATSATTFNLLQNTINTAYLFGNTTNLHLASDITSGQTIGIGTGSTTSGSTKQLLFGTNGVTGSTTNFVFGSSLGSGTLTSKQDSIFEKNLAVVGNTTLTGTLGVTGATTLGALLTANAGISATTLSLSSNATITGTLAVTGNATLTGDLAVNGGDITSSASTFNLLTTSSGVINAFSTSGTISIGGAVTGPQTVGISNGVTAAGQTKTINIGQNGVVGSTTTLNIGSTAGTTNINTWGTHVHNGSKLISSALTVAGSTTLNGSLFANANVVLGDTASDTLIVNATSNFVGPVTIENLLITGSTIENLTINNSFLSKGSSVFNQLIYAKSAINSDTDIVALGEVKANKLKEKYLATGIEKYLGDIYQAKYEGAAGVNVLNLPKKTILAISNGARAFGSVGVLEPVNYLTGTYDSANKIYSNTDYNFGVSFENDWLVFKNDSFIKYPAITGVKTDFTIYTCFDDTLAQTAASTTYEFLKFTNGDETLEIGFATNVTKDNLSLVIKRNGTLLTDTITTWPATATAKTAGEVFRDKTIKNRSISFNLFNNVLNVVVGGELVASYAFAALTNNLTTLTVGKSSTNSLICSIKSLVIGQFSASEFSKYTSTWVPNVDYNQELQSNEGKFYIKKELDYVEIVSGKQKPILLETINSFKKQNTFEVDTTFLKPITITDNGRSTAINNHATESYGTTIVSGEETSIYLGSTSYNKPRYNDGTTINDILTEKHAIQTPNGKTIALANGSSLDTLTKTGLNDVYGFASAPTSSKSWFVDTKVASAGTSYIRENIQSFDGLEDYFRIKNGGSFGAWIKNWNANNDGSGSGLDADLLRGLNSTTSNTASTVVTRGASGEFAAGVVTVTGLTNSGNASMAGTLSVTGNTTLTGDLAVNGGDITSSATTFNLLTSTATTVNAFAAATTLSIASTQTTSLNAGFANGATTSGNTKNVWLGTSSVTGSTTNVYIGATAGTSTIALQGNANVTSNFSVAGTTTLTGQLTSTVATGTAPLVVASTTKVENLNADLLDGFDSGLNGNINTIALRGATIGNLQVTGLSTAWGTTSGVNTGGINVVTGTSSSATWLISGTNAGTYKGGIQLLDSGGEIRLYALTGYLNLTSDGVLTSSGGFSGNGSSLTTLNASNLSSGTIPDARITGSYTGMTNLTGSGTVDFSRFLGNAADTASAPSFSWTGDLNTGIYSPAADQLAITTGGVQRLLINSTGVTAATFSGALSGNASTATTLQTARTIAISGDGTGTATSFNGSSNITVPFTLATTGVTAGTYRSVTVDAKGRVTAGTNPTTLSGYGITDAAPSSHIGTNGSVHAVVTTSVNGFMSSSDKAKLDGIATGATNYSHPTGDGNLHVPLTGTINNKKVLMSGATAGSLAWNFVSWNDLQDKPSVLLTTDIAAWAKAGTKPTYTPSEVGAYPSTGGVLGGNATFNGDFVLEWVRNTDYSRIGFKNTRDGDVDSYMYFETGDNSDEYFKWRGVASGPVYTDYMTLKHPGVLNVLSNITINGSNVYHEGRKPTWSEIGSKPTTVAGYGITDSFEVKSSAATDADGLVLKGSYLIADTEKSYILVQSTRVVATEITPVTQIKMPTEGTGSPAWRRGSGNPIVWEAWKPLGGISEEASIDYNSTTKSIDFSFTGV